MRIIFSILALSFFINWARGEIVIKINPLMPLTSVELKGLQTFANNVSVLTSGEVRFRVIAFDSRKTLFDKLENVSDGLNIAAFGHTHVLSDKEPAALLFGAPPVTDGLGFDNTSFFSWFYSAGGSLLYDEMWDNLDLNIKGFILQTSGPRALGWFREPFYALDDLKGKRIRDSFDFTGLIHKEIGLRVIPLKGADIIPELEKKNLDAVSWCCPSSDLMIGIHESIGNYYLQGISRNILNSDLYINKSLYSKLSLQHRKAIEVAATASILEHSSLLLNENGKALKELVENYNVIVHDTPKEYFQRYKKVAKDLLEKKAQDNDFFARVWQSQKDFAIVGLSYWSKLQNVHKGLYDEFDKRK